jgi:hypothetical protein
MTDTIRNRNTGNGREDCQVVYQPCPYCGGTGKVANTVDDLEFEFDCTCAGGNEEAICWLLGLEWPTIWQRPR